MDFDTYWRRVRQARADCPDRSVLVFHKISSSHDLARRVVGEYQAESVEPPPVDLLAWEQSTGKGRQGRTWSSPPGSGVYASMIRQVEPELTPRLPLLVSIALASVLRDVAAVSCRLKWPNDLVVDGRKLGGILIDVQSSRDGPAVVILSFGLNHGSDAAAHFNEPGAVSTLDLGSTVGLDELAVASLDGVDRRLAAPASLESVVGEYRELCAHRPGDVVECRLTEEAEKTRGVFQGIDERGFLRLRIGEEERVLSSGRLLD